MTESDTIASIATAPGAGSIGIVRISGPEAVPIAERIFTGIIQPTESHRMYYGHIKDPASGELVDEVMLSIMLAPRTYTREDVIEINCHGGMVAISLVLALILRQGARPAEPGEFTRRAFMNGRLDLSQAEAVLDVINARSAKAEQMALGQLKGMLSKRIEQLRAGLLDVCSELEAHIDFPDDEIEPASINRIDKAMLEAKETIASMLRTYEGGRLYREGLKTAIVGRPNVGKSSLLNALVEEERAIVTEVPGTTRDIVEDFISIKGLPLRIMDTAGIRESHDMVEQEGVRRSLAALSEADMVIAVFDGSQPLHDEDMLVLEKLKGKKSIIVHNKADLTAKIATQQPEQEALRVSAKSGEGIEALRQAIYETALGRGGINEGQGVVITNARHRDALDRGAEAILAARKSLGSRPLEITAMELREALAHLGSIIGELTPDDMLNNIFKKFCIGK